MSYLTKDGNTFIGSSSSDAERDDTKQEEVSGDVQNEDMWVYCSEQLERAAHGLVGKSAVYENELTRLRPWFNSLSESKRQQVQKRINFSLQHLIYDYSTTGSNMTATSSY